MSHLKSKQEKMAGLIKGTPTAVLVSIGIHVGLLVLAGGFVVFKIIEQKQVDFIPVEKFDRPKMKLKKLRVKVKENTKPKRSTDRIMSKTTQAMPDIALPPMTGLGGGLGEGLGGFQMMADLSKVSLIGGQQSLGNDLTGVFYDFNRLKSGAENLDMPPKAGNQDKMKRIMQEFLASDWDLKVFDTYYKAPKTLYATQFMVPPYPSRVGPSKFGISDDIIANYWAIVYKGKIGLNRGGRFRFWGRADDLMFVRINGKLVLDASHDHHRDYTDWQSDAYENHRFPYGSALAYVGDWFELKPGEQADMDLLISEIPGGTFQMTLCIEEEGVDYPKNDHDAPILPIFKTMEMPPHLVDEIKYGTVPDRYDITGGPIFGIY